MTPISQEINKAIQNLPVKEPVVEKPDFNEKVVLVAEDDDNNFFIIDNILSSLNLTVIRAVNGKDAVNICRLKNIDLVLMDIKMPVMDGYTATKLIIESNPGQRIIAQTAFSEDRDYALSCGCVGFIAKPFGKKQLVSLLDIYL